MFITHGYCTSTIACLCELPVNSSIHAFMPLPCTHASVTSRSPKTSSTHIIALSLGSHTHIALSRNQNLSSLLRLFLHRLSTSYLLIHNNATTRSAQSRLNLRPMANTPTRHSISRKPAASHLSGYNIRRDMNICILSLPNYGREFQSSNQAQELECGKTECQDCVDGHVFYHLTSLARDQRKSPDSRRLRRNGRPCRRGFSLARDPRYLCEGRRFWLLDDQGHPQACRRTHEDLDLLRNSWGARHSPLATRSTEP